jgi:hypothetical protein
MNDIYINLLIALEAILEWYKQSSWSKSALPVPQTSWNSIVRVWIYTDIVEHVKDSFLKNSNYGYKIDQCLENIRESKSRFMEETQLYQAWSQQAILSTTLANNTQSREINSNVLGLGGRIGEVQSTLQEVKAYGRAERA